MRLTLFLVPKQIACFRFFSCKSELVDYLLKDKVMERLLLVNKFKRIDSSISNEGECNSRFHDLSVI